MEPMMIDIPMPILTERLQIRGPREGDGYLMNQAIIESQESLKTWMEWAQKLPTAEESEINTRRSTARWILREDLRLLIFDRSGQSLLGGSGLHRIDWQKGRFEIGYWVRSSEEGKGYIREATAAITQFAFSALKARRVEIRCDAMNIRSAHIPRKLGFPLEGILKNDGLDAAGLQARDTLIFARTDIEGLPDVKARWG